jgi:DNA-directed RNA polymerase specialized sigma24 family protein
MIEPAKRPLHPLDQPWPGFLDRLDSAPGAAFGEFYAFAWRLLTSHPPAVLRSLPLADRGELVSEVILHCWRNECRVLRTYRNRDIPFSRWLLMVARHKTLDSIKARERRPATDPSQCPGAEDANRGPLIDPAPSVETQLIIRQNLELVHRCILQMGHNCQLLLLGNASGLKPREMTRLLGWPSEAGKKVSDSLRYCRQKLKESLRQEGLDWREMIGRKTEIEKAEK